jgi:hypothetical protein
VAHRIVNFPVSIDKPRARAQLAWHDAEDIDPIAIARLWDHADLAARL